MNNYYLIIDGQKKGPYTETRVQNMWENKHIGPGTECLKEGETDPRPIEDFPEITSPSTVKKPAAAASSVAATSAISIAAAPASPVADSPAAPVAASTPAWKFILILLVGAAIGGVLIFQFGGKLFGPGTDANATDANATAPKKGISPKTDPDANATAPKKGTSPKKGPDTNATKTNRGKVKSKNKK